MPTVFEVTVDFKDGSSQQFDNVVNVKLGVDYKFIEIETLEKTVYIDQFQVIKLEKIK